MTNAVETNVVDGMQFSAAYLMALTGEPYVDLVTFSDEQDPLDVLEAITQ
jgi:hypothetical protein